MKKLAVLLILLGLVLVFVVQVVSYIFYLIGDTTPNELLGTRIMLIPVGFILVGLGYFLVKYMNNKE